MKSLTSPSVVRAFNVGLRLSTLVAKLGLTLYMGKFLSLNDMGLYGLVFGATMILSGLLGIRFDYVVSREIVGLDWERTGCIMRDQLVFYGLNYIVLAVVMAGLIVADCTGISARTMLYILALSVAEGVASITYVNMNSMHRPVMANVIFAIRAAIWAVPVIGLGVFMPSFRTIDMVLISWLVGVILSQIATLWAWRRMPWRAVLQTPVDWQWMKTGVRKCMLIWLGTIGLSLGFYVDRFIVMRFLGIEKVGIATFYFSFANALLALIQSGVLSFSYPRFIMFHREGNRDSFRHEVWQAHWHVMLFASIIAVGMGLCVPLLGYYFHRPELVADAYTLWLMLVGIFIRASAETFYYILFARHQDKPIWLGNLLFLIPAFGANALLVPVFGLSGIGYGMILASGFLLIWRWYFVIRGNHKSVESPHAVQTSS